MAHLTARETAARIGIKVHTLAVWRCSGRGPSYVRLGSPRDRVVYPVCEVEAWLAARTFSSTSEESAAARSRS